jgi:hypothetical protein
MVAWPSMSLTTLGWIPPGQQDRRDRVPEVMEPDRREPRSLGVADEQARERLRVRGPAVFGGNHQARVGVIPPLVLRVA